MSVATPPQVTQPFATTGTANTIPVASQIGITPGAASFTDGFPPLTATPIGSGGIPPTVGDMNGILKMLSAHVAYLQSGAGYQFSSAIATAIGGYNIGAMLLSADNSGYWLNLTNNNSTNPDTGGAGWVPVSQYGLGTVSGLGSSNVTLTATQYGKQILVLTGALTANINLVFPNLATSWIIVNNTTGAFSITCKTASGTGVTVAQGGWSTASTVQGDGTNIYSQAGNFVTNAALTTALSSYVTSASLAATLGGYVTQASLTSQLSAYETTAGLGAILAYYVPYSYLAATYVSNAQLTTSLASYLTTASAASNYVSTALLATTLSSYVTATTMQNYVKGTGSRSSTSMWQSDQSLFTMQSAVTGTINPGGQLVNFPTAFANACVSVITQPYYGLCNRQINSQSRTGFVVGVDTPCAIAYMAMGY